MHNQLFVQTQDRFFSVGAHRIHEYLLKDPIYGGELAKQGDTTSGEG